MILLNDRTVSAPTASEYSRRYKAARAEAARMGTASRSKLAEVYVEASAQAARVVVDTLERGLSKLTADRWAVVEAKLKGAADSLAQGTETVAHALVGQAAPLFPEVDAQFLYQAMRYTGAKGITKEGLGRVVAGVSSRVVESMTTRLWSDGYTFSDRIWKTGLIEEGGLKGQPISVRGDWMERLRMTVAAGIAQGRDPVKIAKDIQVYTTDGKIALGKRWGSLERGTAEFAKRIPGRLDWRAQRLVRSVLGDAIREASALSGDANPACDGLFDWVLSMGRQHSDICDEWAAGGPYKSEDLPEGHPNDMCHVQPHLREMGTFLGDLKRWAKGEGVDYLDEWYAGTYKAAA